MEKNEEFCFLNYISTRSTLTPQGSVASSNELCIVWEMVSRSDRISAKFFVPKTLRSVVAASKRVEWLLANKYNNQKFFGIFFFFFFFFEIKIENNKKNKAMLQGTVWYRDMEVDRI